MDIIKYDGTRFITEEEIDNEFTEKWVLVKLVENGSFRDGYLIASADDTPENRWALDDIGMDEYDGQATIIYGCKTRGQNLHVALLD